MSGFSQVRVVWENQVLGEGSGRSKKQAETAAALAALKEQAWTKREIRQTVALTIDSRDARSPGKQMIQRVDFA